MGIIILPSQNESQIPQWQIDEVLKRTENNTKNPDSAMDIEAFLKEFDSEI